MRNTEVTCPTCGAGPGWQCQSRGGGVTTPHAARVRECASFRVNARTDEEAARNRLAWDAAAQLASQGYQTEVTPEDLVVVALTAEQAQRVLQALDALMCREAERSAEDARGRAWRDS